MQKIIEIALSQIGTKEDPANSNKTEYGAWFGLDGVAWCGIFVSWVYAMAGRQLPNIGFSKGFAKCQTAVKYFREHNMITTTPVMGDIVFFDWNNDERYDHTGIYLKEVDALNFDTIEGNTAIGNDSNGGEVMPRTRKYSHAIFVHVNNEILV
jgi:hypothetical protein